MDELDTLAMPEQHPPSSKKPKRAITRDRVVKVEQPMICPLASASKGSAEMVEVRILKRHSQQLWISEKNIPWLVQYMATEYALSGVAEDPDTPGDGGENVGEASAVAEAAIHWDWDGNDGYYTMLNGQKVACDISTFTEAKWNKVCSTIKYRTTFQNATYEQLAQASHDFLQLFIESQT